MQSSLAELATQLGLTWDGPSISFQGVCTDTRELTPGCLFVALSGEHFDGHDFVAEASKQAVACVVSRPVDTSAPTLQVENTLLALQQMAANWRESFHQPVVAITGSCGKTSTRALLASILATQGSVHASIKSHNNHIGVPLTLLGVRPEHHAVIAEVGTDSPGEIASLAALVQPTVAVITMAAPVHLSGLLSLERIVEEKGDLIRSLQPGGIAVLNVDSPAYETWLAMVPQSVQVVSFGVTTQADVLVTEWETLPGGHSRATLTVDGRSVSLHLPVLGQHNAANVAAACAAAKPLGVSLAAMAEGLSKVTMPPHRLIAQSGKQGALIIDDSFNANPVAVKAAIAVLAECSQPKRILVLGDMLELADSSRSHHEEVAQMARDAGFDALLLFGEETRHAIPVFGDQARHYETHDDLIADLLGMLDAETAVLIKGSHSMHMDVVATACMNEEK